MALEKWNGSAAQSGYPEGAVLFDTTLPGDRLLSYHAMVIRADASRTRPDGGVELPIADMGRASINWPRDDQWHRLHADCYIGWFPELPPERTREAVEELNRLYTSPLRLAKETYTLAQHGIFADDPNAPGNPLPGIACSCASLVEYCYWKISPPVDLVVEDRVPQLSAEELWALVGLGPWQTGLKVLFARMGLKPTPGAPEPPRWPVLLPAYQMHAFATGWDKLHEYQPRPEHHPYR